jgi:hypothetical protein
MPGSVVIKVIQRLFNKHGLIEGSKIARKLGFPKKDIYDSTLKSLRKGKSMNRLLPGPQGQEQYKTYPGRAYSTIRGSQPSKSQWGQEFGKASSRREGDLERNLAEHLGYGSAPRNITRGSDLSKLSDSQLRILELQAKRGY